MLKDNLIMLRKLHEYSQEQIAEKIGISRQAYAKWESGATIPDIDRAALLAEVYGITLDSLMKTETTENVGMVPPAPKGKNIWGTVTLGDRGQLVIPKNAREHLGIKGGDRMIVATDEIGVHTTIGENDSLSAIVAVLVDADLLVLLSDIDGLYTKDPHVFPDAELISVVEEITPEIKALAGEKGSPLASAEMSRASRFTSPLLLSLRSSPETSTSVSRFSPLVLSVVREAQDTFSSF